MFNIENSTEANGYALQKQSGKTCQFSPIPPASGAPGRGTYS